MDDAFFRFPHTPHLAWFGEGAPRDDKVFSAAEREVFLAHELIVEEKVDGANLGLSFDSEGNPRIQNRGGYLLAPFSGQFRRLGEWFARHEGMLFDALGDRLILFGEWTAARHSLEYSALPDWFIGFDLYDREVGGFWSTRRRDGLMSDLGIAVVARLHRGGCSLRELRERLGGAASHYREGGVEGFYLRVEDEDWLKARAKLVSPGFTQNIGEHWSRRALEWNRLGQGEFAGTRSYASSLSR